MAMYIHEEREDDVVCLGKEKSAQAKEFKNVAPCALEQG